MSGLREKVRFGTLLILFLLSTTLSITAQVDAPKSQEISDDEGYLEGLISVALPVYGLNRSILGTVAVHAPVARLSLERGLAYVPQIRRAASELASAYRRVASA